MTKAHDSDNRLNELVRQAFYTGYLKNESGTIRLVHAELRRLVHKENEFRIEKDVLRVPSLRSLYDWIDRQDDKEVLRMRFGMWTTKIVNHSVDKGIKPTRLLELSEINNALLNSSSIEKKGRIAIDQPRLTFNVNDCPVQKPNFKGKIEKYFRTINVQFLRGLPGSHFYDNVDKQNHDPAKDAVIRLQAFEKLMHMFIADIHTQD
jgi:hypothetical protein